MQNVLFHAGFQCVQANRVLHCKNRNKHFVLLEIQMHSIQLNMTFYAVEGGVAVQTLNHLGQHVARVGLWPPYPWQSSLLQPLRSKGKPISDSLRSCINYFSAFPKNSSQIKLKAEKRNEGGLVQPPGRLQPAAGLALMPLKNMMYGWAFWIPITGWRSCALWEATVITMESPATTNAVAYC